MFYIWQYENWNNFTWNSDVLLEPLAKARFAQGQLLAKVQDFNFEMSLEAQGEILIEETIKTSEIEGEIFDRDSVRSSVLRRLGIPSAALPTKVDRNAESLIEVLLQAVGNYSQALNVEMINLWHGLMFANFSSVLYEVNPGSLRTNDPMRIVSGRIGQETVHFEAPPREILEDEYVKFVDWWNNSLGTLDGIIRAAIAHFWFVTLHPYCDGNGRLARILTDTALAQDEKSTIRYYSLSSQLMKNRESYYDVLEKTQKKKHDITLWLKFFCETYIEAIQDSEQIIEKVLLKSRFWTKFSQVEINDKQKKVINKLLDAGRGNFQGNINTRKYMGITKTSRATAYRDITDLVEKGILTQLSAKGRSTAYDINWDM